MPTMTQFILNDSDIEEVIKDEYKYEIIKKFNEDFVKSRKDLPQEFIDIVNKHFWEMI
jgi:hypothetical protein